MRKNVEQMIIEAREIAEKEGMRFEDVLYLFEIDSRQMASVLIERMYEELQSIKKLLQEMKQFDDTPNIKML